MKRLSAADVAAARVQLANLADSLHTHKFFGPAQTIRDYLAGKVNSLDEAFGLIARTRRRGAPADPDRGLLIAREIDPLKRQGKTWEAIEEELDKPGCLGKGLTVRQLRRHYETHFDIDSGGVPEWRRTSKEIAAISDAVVRRLRKKDAAATSVRSRTPRISRVTKPAKSKIPVGSAAG